MQTKNSLSNFLRKIPKIYPSVSLTLPCFPYAQTQNTLKATDSLSEMQDTIKDTNQKFMDSLNEMNNNLMTKQYELTQDNQKIHRRLND